MSECHDGCCGECGFAPAKGNIVYRDDGRRPLCRTCNQLPASRAPLTVADCLTVPEVRALVEAVTSARASAHIWDHPEIDAALAAMEGES